MNNRFVVASIAIQLVSCVTTPPTPLSSIPEAEVRPAPEELTSVEIYVADPEVKFVQPCKGVCELGPKERDRFATVLREAFVKAGVHVASRPSSARITVVPSIELKQNPIGFNNLDFEQIYSFSMRASLSGREIASSSMRTNCVGLLAGCYANQFVTVSGSKVAANLTNDLFRSESLAAVGRENHRADAPSATTEGAKGEQPPNTSAQPPLSTASESSRYVVAAPQPTAYAVVVGIERYPRLPSPTGARRDAEAFAQLAQSTLGLREDRIRLVLDERATRGTIEGLLEWARTSVPPGGRIYFFYSGHGSPDVGSGTPFLVPVDGDPQYLAKTSLLLSDLLAKLSDSKAREVVALLDSCFSGAGGRSVLPPGTRPLIRVKEIAPHAQTVVLAAASGSQVSGGYAEKGHGLFSYELLDALGTGAADFNGDGQISMQELADWITPRVEREAKKANREQRPSLIIGKQLGAASDVIFEWGLAKR